VPTDSPRNTFTRRLISELVEPTAASASLPENCPTTMTSAALYNSCKTPVSISGMEKLITLRMIDPLHKSISYLPVFMHSGETPLSASFRYWV
jgi:hypothetical protein